MENFLNATAWTMAEPKPYGLFHIVMLLVGIPVSIALAWKLRRVSDRSYHRILFAIAVILLLSELYKQLFHFYVMDNKTYDWWIFPFQLCSLPMYLCAILPFMKKKQMADSSGNLPDGFQSAWRSYGAAGSGWPHASLYHLDAACLCLALSSSVCQLFHRLFKTR
ncbi:YwaF family protein [[Clostridium] innocuum]|uniref:TMEM164 family acyltransferase n=1 Tax=Clostridium innocuum TaxID=1522 RepID=UPI001F44D472|nr:YwaF family protein [[Clostridium] innocuum]